VIPSSKGVPPFQVAYSGRWREGIRQLLARAQAQGRSVEVGEAVRDIDTRLQWIPLDFGEPLRDLPTLGIQLRIATVAPLVVKFGVAESRRIVYVSLPYDLLPRSGL
jgi:hypothetical protein